MASLFKNIARAKRGALIDSYEDNKERIFYIAQNIDKGGASKATISVFKNAWNDIASMSNIKESDFTSFIVHKLANYFQRNAAKAKKNEIMNTCDKLSIEYSMNHEAVAIPAEVDAKIYETIESMSSQAKKGDKTLYITIGSVTAVAVLCIALMAFLASDQNPFTKGETTMIGNNTLTSNKGPNSGTSSNDASNKEPMTSSYCVDLDSEATYYADIEIKNHGTITVQLDQKSAPITVANFIGLANKGFYDGLTFHRIIEGFMMQGGDPNGNGTGGSGENISGEFTANGFNNNLSHTKGAISMARSSANDSASSQFFIVHEYSPSLDGKYAVFGYVTEGLDIVDTICEEAKPTDGNGTIPKSEQPVIKSIKIRTVEKGE